MKKLILPLLTVLLLVAALSSCHKSDFKTELKTIDSLKTTVERSEKTLNSIVPDEVNGITSKILADLDSAEMTLEKNKLTITREDAVFFGRYKALTSSVESFNALYNKLKTELSKTKEQLSNLKTDLANGTIEEDKASSYIKAEKNSVTTLNDAVAHLDSIVKNLREKSRPYQDNFAERMAGITKGKEKPKKKK
jgi:chromosome segregation ATPase